MRRIPRFIDDLEIIFVEGHSKDGTWDEIERVIATGNAPGERSPKADAIAALGPLAEHFGPFPFGG